MADESLEGMRRYLRRKKSLAELKALADTAFASATDTVTITSNSYEGGSASGVVTFRKDVLLTVLEQLIAELDPNNTPDDRPSRSAMVYSDRSGVVTRL